MKKMLFGIGLLLSGIVGFVGWCIAAAMTVEPGAVSHVFGCLYGRDWLILLIFAALAVGGLAISAIEYRKA